MVWTKLLEKNANSRTKKKTPIVSSARLRLFTAVQCVSAPVQNTSMDFGVHAFIYYAHSFCVLETTATDIWVPLWLQLSSTEGEMEPTAGPLQCLGTLHGTDRGHTWTSSAWPRHALWNVPEHGLGCLRIKQTDWTLWSSVLGCEPGPLVGTRSKSSSGSDKQRQSQLHTSTHGHINSKH